MNVLPENALSWLDSIQGGGFAVISSVLTPRDVDALGVEIAAADMRRGRAGVRHAMRLPSISSLAKDERLLGIARSILGNQAFPFNATLFDKSPTANWLVAWHQDTALPLKERREIPEWGPWSVKEGVTYAHAPANALSKILALRVHLDNSTAENGPLRVLPGTHTLGVLTDNAIHELSMRVTSVDCLVPKCGVLAIRPLIVHASSKSQSRSPRRVLHVEYAESPTLDSLELATA